MTGWLSCTGIWAQTIHVTGTITDAKTNEPLIGATVVVKGTTNGAITDVTGQFMLEAPSNATLSISFISYNSQEITLNGQTNLNIQLEPQSFDIEQVVVVGYGSQKMKDLTAPIVSVKGEDLSRQVAANPMQALQGKMTGVQIINDGSPGSSSTVKIRGVGSVGDYATPLYIVDGVFVENIDFLNNGDIEDITVLKDASAAAIYGVRAANGVVLVTTRKGKSGKAIVSYDGYAGWQVPVNIMPLASTNEYVTLLNEANKNIDGYVPKNATDYPASTDWYAELVHPAFMQNHTLDISGGTEKGNYSLGVNYFYQDGIMEAENDYERINLRGRFEQKINPWLKIGLNTIISSYNQQKADNNAFFSAFVNPPVYKPYDDANTDAYPVKFGSPQQYGFGNQYGNPLATAYYNDDYEKGYKVISAVFAEMNLYKDILTFKTSLNQELQFWNTRDYTPQYLVGGSQGLSNSSLTKSAWNSSKQIMDNLLTYKDKAGLSSYSVLLGQSSRIEKDNNLYGSAINVPGYDDQAKYLVNGSATNRNAWDGGNRYQGLSFFTRATWNYDEKYLATATFRADGSSKYQDKWGYFPSLGLGWVMSSEPFIKNLNSFDYLKLRASWGMLGNDNIPANSTYILGESGSGSSGVFGDELVDGVGAQTVYQNYLKWEVVNEFDLGVDFAFKGNVWRGEIDYYHRTTNNVVFYAPIATGGGVAQLLGNNGSVLNSGIEVAIHYNKNLNMNSSLGISLNATTIHNEVTELNNRDYIPGGMVRGNYTTRTQVGHPIGSFYGYEIAGVYASETEALQDPVSQVIKDKGFFKYKDQNGDKVITEDDKVFLGSPIPKVMTGLDVVYTYKQFDASMTIQGQFGNKVINAKRMNRDVFVDGNYDKDFYDNRWTSSNKSNKYPSAEAYNYSFTQQANTFFVEDAWYIRIQNIQLGYNIKNIPNISLLRFYVSAQRPFTYFTYNGFTPEVGGDPINSGIDTSVYPMQAIYTVGAKINF